MPQSSKRPLGPTDDDDDGDCTMGVEQDNRCTRARTSSKDGAKSASAAPNLRVALIEHSAASLAPGKWRAAMNA
jgi:hypothetical protein